MLISEHQGQILTAPEVAKMPRVSPQWVYGHANGNRKPHLPSKKFGGARQFVLSEVKVFVEAYTEQEAA
jgi:predicted DNA-binding transcriptional regulator AlpA